MYQGIFVNDYADRTPEFERVTPVLKRRTRLTWCKHKDFNRMFHDRGRLAAPLDPKVPVVKIELLEGPRFRLSI